MELYEAYLKEIIERSKLGLGPKPIDQGNLLQEIIDIILEPEFPNRNDAVKYFIYNTLPGTTSAASVKAKFLKKIILKSELVDEIDQKYLINTEMAKNKGIFGSPTFIVENEVFWGDDRCEDAIKWLSK